VINRYVNSIIDHGLRAKNKVTQSEEQPPRWRAVGVAVKEIPPPSTQFQFGQNIGLQESRTIEFKGGPIVPELQPWPFADFKRRFKEILGSFVSGALNSRLAGHILFGVQDDGVVQGVQGLDQDLVEQRFSQIMHKFFPAIGVQCYSIKFIPVTLPKDPQENKNNSVQQTESHPANDVFVVCVTLHQLEYYEPVYFSSSVGDSAFVRRDSATCKMAADDMVTRISEAAKKGLL